MPGWAQVITGLGAVFAAGALLWGKAVRPVIRLAAGNDALQKRIEDAEARLDALERER